MKPKQRNPTIGKNITREERVRIAKRSESPISPTSSFTKGNPMLRKQVNYGEKNANMLEKFWY